MKEIYIINGINVSPGDPLKWKSDVISANYDTPLNKIIYFHHLQPNYDVRIIYCSKTKSSALNARKWDYGFHMKNIKTYHKLTNVCMEDNNGTNVSGKTGVSKD